METRKKSVEIWARVGNLPGEFALEDRMTDEELLRFFARLRGVRDLGYACELSERLGADLGRPMRRLSRGNKQKIGLIQGVTDLEAEGERLSLTLHEPPYALVKLAARHRLVGLEYERPSLEEVFVTYYGGHENGGASS